ncbi:MAG TPA: GNAT family N-acetyltransferase [Solirubrobacterales bacterium]|nr:GNAT family N-acetyltransferase [Solirubrobacterales bacterium]
MKANLIADGGAAASDPENFFRSPAFLQAEGATHTVEIEGDDAVRLPVIVRPIHGSEGVDAISPYGYPGASEQPDSPLDPGEIDWSGTGLASAFIRGRIGGTAPFTGGTVRNHVHIAENDSGIRKRLREQIRRNERRGWEIGVLNGPEAAAADRATFERAYGETMARTGAADRYLFPSEYFESLLRSERTRLLLAARGSEGLAGAIAVASDGYLHYYLGGTADEALDDSPMKNLFAAMISLGSELGLPVSLGGGMAPGDSLDAFKSGFATGEAPFRTHELICDPDAYAELVARSGPAPEGFFPAYRS